MDFSTTRCDSHSWVRMLKIWTCLGVPFPAPFWSPKYSHIAARKESTVMQKAQPSKKDSSEVRKVVYLYYWLLFHIFNGKTFDLNNWNHPSLREKFSINCIHFLGKKKKEVSYLLYDSCSQIYTNNEISTICSCNYQKKKIKIKQNIEFIKYPRKKICYRILRIFLHQNKD